LLLQRRSGSALPLTGPASQEGVLAAEPNAINPAGIPPLVEARSADFNFGPGVPTSSGEKFRFEIRRRLLAFPDRPSHAPSAENDLSFIGTGSDLREMLPAYQ